MLIRFVYTCLLLLAAPVLLMGLYKSKPNKPKFGSRWKEHFGFSKPLTQATPPIWIHAVSVGESIAAVPLIKALKQRNPQQPVLVTTTTSTGAAQIDKLGVLVEHRYMPLDFSFAIKRFLRIIKPQKMLIIETELWPNTIAAVAKQGLDIHVINARLSEKSCQGYQRVQPLFNQIQRGLSKVLCQNQDDAERFIRLGVHKDKVHVTGSIKFDINISPQHVQSAQQLRQHLSHNGKNNDNHQRFIWIAASTHKGEDEQVLAAHKTLLLTSPNALLVLVPRHPERFDAVFELCQQQFSTQRRTQHQASLAVDCQIYLADTMGEMLTLMGASDVCFMGGSLLGNKVGGHNVLEPAALGLPTLIGPSYFNFQEISEQLITAQHLQVCQDSQQLAEQLMTLHPSTTNYQQRSNAGKNVVKQNIGALTKTIQYL